MPEDTQEFGRSFQKFMETMATAGPQGDPAFVTLLREHFERAPDDLVVVGDSFPDHEHPNVQLALEQITASEGTSSRLVGIQGVEHDYAFSMSSLLSRGGGMFRGAALQEGPVQYVTCERDRDVPLSCVQLGLFLVGGSSRFAVLMRGPSAMGFSREVKLEVIAAEREAAEEVLRRVRTGMRELNVYRGKVISLSSDRRDNIGVNFRDVPEVDRASIVLPPGLLDRIERHTLRFSALGERLREAGRHLKRGLLLYGPPGTGKTLTAMYLASRMRDRTVLVITGRGVGLIEYACEIARYLAPSTVILEDADLVAEERSRNERCGVLLFELLNQMDGIAEDADILFILTTNRAEVLEPALAARPGRIDQALEIPLPDAESRRRLIDLYARGIRLDVQDLEPLVRRSAGTSGAFIRELLRKAALFAADDSPGDIVVRDAHLDEAFRELVFVGGDLTRALLGASGAKDEG